MRVATKQATAAQAEDEVPFAFEELFFSRTDGRGIIRVMGKVDAARLSSNRSGLGELIDDLRDFQSFIVDSLSRIQKSSAVIQHGTDGVMKSLEAYR